MGDNKNDPKWVALPGVTPDDVRKAFAQHPDKPKSAAQDIGPGAGDSQPMNYDPGTAVIEPQPLPASAKLTDLPLRWLVLTLLVCIGVSYVWENAEKLHLWNTVQKTGILSEEDKKTVKGVKDIFDRRNELSAQIRKYNELKRRMVDIENGRPARRGANAPASNEPAPKDAAPADKPADDGLALTPEALRGWLQEKAGDQYDSYRKIATMVALAIGGFGLILLALLVRAVGAALLGGVTLAATYFTGIEPLYMWIGAGAAALLGFCLAPRMLLASIYSNGALAGLVLGGIAFGGGAYILLQNELQALMGLGVGAAAGALIGIKFARPLYLCAVLTNSAGLATWILWLGWGELFPYFVPVTFGGLMIVDGVITRIYHKVRWKH